MSKHLRGQRRFGGMNATTEKRQPQPDGSMKEEFTGSAAPAATQAALAPQSPRDQAPLSGAFSAREQPGQAQVDENQGGLKRGAAGGEAYPNGDDPDSVPLSPELPDDQVPNLPGAILKHAREMLGMSQREVAARLQMRVNTVSDLEHERLNQATAVPFVTTYLKRYAQLVNVDPEAVLNLYRLNVEKNVGQMNYRPPKAVTKKAVGIKLIPALLLGVLLLAGGVFLGMHLSSSDEGSADDGALTIAPQQNQPQSAGSQSLQDAQVEASAPLSLPEEDSNTVMARRQAEDLKTNEIIAAAQKPQSDEPQNDEKHAQHGVLNVEGNVKPAGAPIAPVSVAKPEKPQAAASKNAATGLLTATPREEPQAKQGAGATPDNTAAAAPTLGTLREVRARLVNHTQIGSFNTVNVRVKGPVYLRIKGNGSVLKSGVFKAGESVSAIGRPPLRIEVSDSALVSISYAGASVVVTPQGRNVGFNLPTQY